MACFCSWKSGAWKASTSGTGTVPEVTRANAPGTTYYRVKRGDTLFGIARLFDTTVEKIKSLNRLRSNAIRPGTRLKVPGTS